MGLFKKKKDERNTNPSSPKITSFDKIVYKVVNKSNDDDTLYDIADTILDGRPVLIKFENDVVDANRMLAFLSGICYATDGRVIQIAQKLFLLAKKEEFNDGTLYQYIEDVK